MKIDQDSVTFEPFRLDLQNRVLFHGNEAIDISDPALEALIHLIEKGGEVVTQEELKRRNWPGAAASDVCIRTCIAELRRAMGERSPFERYVIEIPSGGYRFVAQIRSHAIRSEVTDQVFSHLSQPMIGRREVVAQVIDALLSHRFVSIIGSAGLGKTTVANAVVREIGQTSKISLVELASLSDRGQILNKIASGIGVSLGQEESVEALAGSLADEPRILVLDNCEHLLEDIGIIASDLFNLAPNIHIITTSREALGVACEHAFRLDPLECPPLVADTMTLAEAMQFPAARLFARSAVIARNGVELVDADAYPIARICSRLDGVPLALEIAAARADSLEIPAMAERLDARIPLTDSRRSPSQPRHQTLRSALDWSYGLLDADERRLLRQLSAFSGFFDFDGALAVADLAAEIPATVGRLTSLVAKSLIVPWNDGGSGYRLLETTRAYARDKLKEEAESVSASRRHARYILGKLKQARSEWGTRPVVDIAREFLRQVDDLRAALNWSLSCAGEKELFFELTISAVPLWLSSAMMAECKEWTGRAIDVIDKYRDVELRFGLNLKASLATAGIYNGDERGGLFNYWSDILIESRSLGDTDIEIRALWGLCLTVSGDRLAAAQTLLSASRSKSEEMMGDQLVGAAHFSRGDFHKSEEHLIKALDDEEKFGFVPNQALVRSDNRLFSQITLAKVLWITGRIDQSISLISSASDDVIQKNHAMLICPTMGCGACPINLWTGNIDVLSSLTHVLQSYGKRHGLPWWVILADAYKGIIMIKSGDFSTGEALLSESISSLQAKFSHHPAAELCLSLAEARASAGDFAGANEALGSAFDRIKKLNQRWLVAEALRLKGVIGHLEHGARGLNQALDCFEEAIQTAREQGALSWQLRAAYSCASVLADAGREADAVEVLTPVYDQFSEGFLTADLKSARLLMEDLMARAN